VTRSAYWFRGFTYKPHTDNLLDVTFSFIAAHYLFWFIGQGRGAL